MRKPFIVGNWKMNLGLADGVALATEIKAKADILANVSAGICPPSVFLSEISKRVKGSKLCLGVQNMHDKESGAYTGEISGQMIKDVGCTHSIIGHSERRHLFGESNELINSKLKTCISMQISPIFCVGETLEEREADKTTDVIDCQLRKGLSDIAASDIKKITIAYEPVWAIGTGKTASPEQANKVHAFIRNFLSKEFGNDIAETIIIQYGGSVKPDNIKELLTQKDIDGALVGGASLKASSFIEMLEIGNNL